jgi:hypothetical protein
MGSVWVNFCLFCCIHAAAAPTTATPINIFRQTNDSIITNIPKPMVQEDRLKQETEDTITAYITRKMPKWKYLHNHVEWEIPKAERHEHCSLEHSS